MPPSGALLAQKGGVVFVRLKKKLANMMDGVDASHTVRAGDLLNLPDKQAGVLIAEGWAEALHGPPLVRQVSTSKANQAN